RKSKQDLDARAGGTGSDAGSVFSVDSDRGSVASRKRRISNPFSMLRRKASFSSRASSLSGADDMSLADLDGNSEASEVSHGSSFRGLRKRSSSIKRMVFGSSKKEKGKEKRETPEPSEKARSPDHTSSHEESGHDTDSERASSVDSNKRSSSPRTLRGGKKHIGKRVGKLARKLGRKGSRFSLRARSASKDKPHRMSPAGSRGDSASCDSDSSEDAFDETLNSPRSEMTQRPLPETFQPFFTRQEMAAIRDWQRETVFETLSGILSCTSGDGELDDNPFLTARLATMIEDEDDLLRALAILSSDRPEARILLLYRMHDLSDSESGCSADDLRVILRNSRALREAVRPIDRHEGRIVLDRYEALLPVLRLEAFYHANAPERLPKVATILAKYEGRHAVLWKKLSAQYDGAVVPSEDDVLPMLTVMPVVDQSVAEAFAPVQGERMSFADFCSWVGEPPASAVQDLSQGLEDWRDILDGALDKADALAPLSDWFRVAQVPANAESGSVRLSALSWRRRWCRTVVRPDGSTVLTISKEDHQEPLLSVSLSAQDTAITIVERPTHKHRFSVQINASLFLQVSRGSITTFDDLVMLLRKATFTTNPHQQHPQPQDSPTSEHEELSVALSQPEGASPSSRGDVAHDSAREDEDDHVEQQFDVENLELRVSAFYMQQNPDKIDSVPSILQKYEGRETELLSLLTKQYPGSRIPGASEAAEIVQNYRNAESEGSTMQESSSPASSAHDGQEDALSSSAAFSEHQKRVDEDEDSDEEELLSNHDSSFAAADDDDNDDDDDASSSSSFKSSELHLDSDIDT
ncbi:Uncharacterized protein SCF082_LOCUS7249, partial [Durusdinium trenchii]